MRRRQAARLDRRRRTALAGDPNRHEAWCLNACCRRELVPPHREQPADNAIAPSDLGNIGAFLEALRYDPCLLFRRPLPPPALSGDQLDTTIRTAFLPDIMHGICHRFTPNDQLMPSCIADQAHHREVGASYRLQKNRHNEDGHSAEEIAAIILGVSPDLVESRSRKPSGTKK